MPLFFNGLRRVQVLHFSVLINTEYVMKSLHILTWLEYFPHMLSEQRSSEDSYKNRQCATQHAYTYTCYLCSALPSASREVNTAIGTASWVASWVLLGAHQPWGSITLPQLLHISSHLWAQMPLQIQSGPSPDQMFDSLRASWRHFAEFKNYSLTKCRPGSLFWSNDASEKLT